MKNTFLAILFILACCFLDAANVDESSFDPDTVEVYSLVDEVEETMADFKNEYEIKKAVEEPLDKLVEEPLALGEVAEKKKTVEELAKESEDLRSLIASETASRSNARKWLAVRQLFQEEAVLEKTLLQLPIAAVAEAKASYDYSILRENLSFYKSNGFTHVVVTLDGDEDEEQVKELCRTIVEDFELEIIGAFGAGGTIKDSIFSRDPEKIEALVKTLAARSSAFILGYRRTSMHFYCQDRWFTDFIASSARKGNPEIPFIGELYCGESSTRSRRVNANMPEYASAAYMVGNGYKNTNFSIAFKTFKKYCGDANSAVLVFGPKPYYRTSSFNGQAFEADFKEKLSVIKKTKKAGFTFTILMHQDGSNGEIDKDITDDLSKTIYNY